jgi:hypothetical protein
MTNQWRSAKRRSGAPDPLQQHRGAPVLGDHSRGGRQFVGRVVVELWAGATEADDAHGIAYRLEAASGTDRDLLRRVSAALPERRQRQTDL